MQKPSRFDQIYYLIFVLIGALVVASPITARVGLTNYDRVADTLMFLILAVRLIEIGRTGLKILPSDGWFLGPFIVYFTFVCIAEYVLGNFYLPLFALEGKILLFLLTIRLFHDRPLRYLNNRASLSVFVLACFMVASAIFVVMAPGQRLHLLNESNYTILSLLFVALCVIHNKQLDSRQTGWWFLMAALVAMTVVSRSRTGFAMLILYFVYSFTNKRTAALALPVGVAMVVVYIAFGDYLMDIVTRGALRTGVDRIDRLIFLQEYMSSVADKPWYNFFVSWNITDYISDRAYYMGWWVAKQSAQHGIPFGLAPFNFHAAYLRLLSAYGAVITIAFLFYVYHMLRPVGFPVVALIFLAAISMSVFYLSTVNPFVLLALLTISGRGPARQDRRSQPKAIDAPPRPDAQPAFHL
jgi:hypothetical protein